MQHRLRWTGWAAGFLLAIVFAPAQGTGARPAMELRAGAATSNITPALGASINGQMYDRKATHIHDELFARSLVLDNGQTRVAFVVADSCMISREIFDSAKRIIEAETGLATDHILMSATHTHSAPASVSVFQSEADRGYTEFLTRRIADGVRRALNNLAPARIGWGVGKVPEYVFSRRWKMKPSSIPFANPFGDSPDQVQMHPTPGSPDLVEPAGSSDPEVSFLSVQSLEGRPLALLANYSLHYVGNTGDGHVSADYFGMFAKRIRELLSADLQDPPFVGIMSNGTSGDAFWINPRVKTERGAPYAAMRRIADILAAEVFRVCQTIEHRTWVPIGIRQAEIDLVVRRPDPEEVRRAREIMARTSYPITFEQMSQMSRTDFYSRIYARETMLISKFPEKVSLVLQTARIGDLGIFAIPCEVFSAIGLELKQKSPLRPSLTIELANGYHGYLPTPDQHPLGGYETWRARSSYLEVGASPKVVQKLLEMISALN